MIVADERDAPELRLVIPARNEEDRIAETVESFCSYFGSRATIVVVANGCVDGTVEIVTKLCSRFPNLRLLQVSGVIGKGGAVRLGLANGLEAFAGYADADCSAGPAELDKLLSACRDMHVDGAIGSRWLAGSSITRSQSLLRRIASRLFNACVRSFFGLPYHDTQCGAKVFRRAAIDSVSTELTLANFAFDIDLLFALRRAGFSVIELPIVWSDSPLGSKVKLVGSSTSMLAAIVNLRVRHGYFRFFPYLDLMARSAVIPSKEDLSVLCLSRFSRESDAGNSNADLRQIAANLEDQGHVVKWLSPQNLTEFLAETLWYCKKGHQDIDAIIAEKSSFDWLFTISLKPKVRLVPGSPGSANHARESLDSSREIQELFSLLPYEFRFVRRQGEWDIVPRVEFITRADTAAS